MIPVATSIHAEDDRLIVVRQQDVQRLLDENRHLADEGRNHFGHARWRLAARVPAVIVEQWANECGARIGSKEFAAYCRKKLKDGEYAAFRVKGY